VGYLRALGLTLLLEVPVYALALWSLFDVRPLLGIGAGIAVNAVSHPLAFFVLFPVLADVLGSVTALTVVEVAVWLVEASLLFVWLRRKADTLLAVSLVANGLSLSAGLLLLR